MFDIITLGSATVDCFIDTGNKIFNPKRKTIKFPFGSKILIDKLYFYTGGGGTNSAVALSRLGFKVAFIGKIGSGDNSKFIIADLKKEKVNADLIVKSKGRTGYSVILDAKGHDRTVLVFKGNNDDLNYNEINKTKLKCRWFYFASMIGESFKTMQKLAEYANKNNIKILLNPSEYLAKQENLKKVLRYTKILVLNKEESVLISKKKEVKERLKSLLSLGPEIVVITNGPDEINASDGVYLYKLKPRRIKIVETTGAGDAFTSGFLASYIKTNNIEQSLKIGLANSQSAILYLGAKNKLLSWKEALEMSKKEPMVKKELLK